MQNNTFQELIVEEKIIRFQRLASTNDYAKKLILSNSKPVDEGTVIMAVEQFAGRGQQGAIWQSASGQNITASIVLCPDFLNPDQQFGLNIAISNAIYNYLAFFFSAGLSIKWPNDLYVHDKKIAGILIENIIKGNSWAYSIVGIGLNINQRLFDHGASSHTTSLALELNKSYLIDEELIKLSKAIEKSYSLLKQGEQREQRKTYTDRLYRLDQVATYEINGVRVKGEIIGINEEGKLLVNFDGHVTDFGHKEISYVF